MVAAVNSLNEDLYWFCERIFIHGGAYMRCAGGGCSKVAVSLPM